MSERGRQEQKEPQPGGRIHTMYEFEWCTISSIGSANKPINDRNVD